MRALQVESDKSKHPLSRSSIQHIPFIYNHILCLNYEKNRHSVAIYVSKEFVSAKMRIMMRAL